MALGNYNGWSGKVREVRGNRQSQDLKAGKIHMPGECEVCGNTLGLTVHCEEYGSTYQEMLDNLHQLCPYCHGILHLREKWPNRFIRYKHRIRNGTLDVVKFPNLFAFFTKSKGLGDIKPIHVLEGSGIDWLDAIPATQYKGPPKIATVVDAAGLILPDPTIYGKNEEVKGVITLPNDNEMLDVWFNQP